MSSAPLKKSYGDSSKLLWPLDSKPDNLRSGVYALQWFGLSIVQIGVIAMVVGPYLGLDQNGIAALSQRIFFFAGLITLLQITFGHRLPVIEGPASMWWVTFISLANISVILGRSLEVVRTDLMGAMIAAGVFLFLIGVSGIVGKLRKLFTPAVTGCALILLAMQISRTFVSGALGITADHPYINFLAVISSLVTVVVVIIVSSCRVPFLKSINLLIGLFAGWGFYLAFQRQPFLWQADISLLGYPQLFQWGMPTYNLGMVTTGIMVAVILIATNMATTTAVAKVTGNTVDDSIISRSVAFNGIGNFLAGIGSSVGMITLAASAGVVKLSGVASRKPFIIYCVLLMAIGFLPPIGIFLSQIPQPVGYSVMMVAFTQILNVGLQDVKKMALTQRDSFVLGFPIIIGVGIMSLPAANFENLPSILRYVLSNGMFTGLMLCLLMEHLFLRKNRGEGRAIER